METATKVLLSGSDMSDIINALSHISDSRQESSYLFDNMAVELRKGNSIPMWADGESGAIAAERMAEEFRRQSRSATDLINRIEQFDYCETTLSFTYED